MWNDGYVTEIDYVYGYYPEINPLSARFALTYAGIKPSETSTACELGFGQGISIISHAAGQEVSWYGTDFNPKQASNALESVRAANLDTQIYDEDFQTFCNRSDLPMFDYIALHGIWSWVSDANREIILKFIRDKLQVGGVVYTSYNTPQGHASMIPMRKLLNYYADYNVPQNARLPHKIDEAISYAQTLASLEPTFIKANPIINDKLELMAGQDRHYLAHEYFNKDWHPMDFVEVSKLMHEAKLDFGTSANLLESIPDINFNSEQLKFLNEIPNENFREYVKDFFLNQTFRRDYWVKGARQLTATQRTEYLLGTKIILVKDIIDLDLQVKGHLGVANLTKEIYAPIFENLNSLGCCTIKELASKLEGQVNLRQLFEAIAVMVGKGDLSIAQEAVSKASLDSTKKLNNKIAHDSMSASEMTYLASPMTGGAIKVGRFEQLIMLALKHKQNDIHQIVNYVWKILEPQNQRIVEGGKALETDAENLLALQKMVEHFLSNRLRVIEKLGIKL